jgi:hypothetical protein
MPTVSRFFGIIIRIYAREHGVPHFHAHYGDSQAALAIETLSTLEGSLPRRAHALVLEWAVQHREELLANWHRAQRHEPTVAIAPLD